MADEEKRTWPRLTCPKCQSDNISTFCLAVTRDLDPNKKLCMGCGYAWRQVKHIIHEPHKWWPGKEEAIGRDDDGKP